MKVLLITRPGLPIYYGGTNLGGVEQFISNIAKCFTNNRWEVYVPMTQDSLVLEEYHKLGGSLVPIMLPGNSAKNKDENGNCAKDKDYVNLIDKIDLSQFDLIFNNHWNPTILRALHRNLPEMSKCLTYLHGLPSEMIKTFIPTAEQVADKILFVTNSDCNYENWISVARSRNLQNLEKSLRKVVLRIPDECSNIDFYNEFEPYQIIGIERTIGNKQSDLLIHLAKNNQALRFRIFDALDRTADEYLKLFGELPSNFKFEKPLNREELIKRHITGHMLYFNRSKIESYGITCAEALMCGRPIIALANSTSNSRNFVECSNLLYKTEEYKVYETGITVNRFNLKKNPHIIMDILADVDWNIFSPKVIRKYFLDNFCMTDNYINEFLNLFK